MKKNYINAEIVICGLSTEDIMSVSSEIAALNGKIAVNNTAPSIGGDSINIDFGGLGD